MNRFTIVRNQRCRTLLRIALLLIASGLFQIPAAANSQPPVLPTVIPPSQRDQPEQSNRSLETVQDLEEADSSTYCDRIGRNAYGPDTELNPALAELNWWFMSCGTLFTVEAGCVMSSGEGMDTKPTGNNVYVICYVRVGESPQKADSRLTGYGYVGSDDLSLVDKTGFEHSANQWAIDGTPDNLKLEFDLQYKIDGTFGEGYIGFEAPKNSLDELFLRLDPLGIRQPDSNFVLLGEIGSID